MTTPEQQALRSILQIAESDKRGWSHWDEVARLCRWAADRAASVAPGIDKSPMSLSDDEGTTVAELLADLVEAHKNWGGWSGLPDTVDRIRSALAASEASRAAEPAKTRFDTYPGGWLNSGPPDPPDCDPRC